MCFVVRVSDLSTRHAYVVCLWLFVLDWWVTELPGILKLGVVDSVRIPHIW